MTIAARQPGRLPGLLPFGEARGNGAAHAPLVVLGPTAVKLHAIAFGNELTRVMTLYDS
jgi:hypothetical protein